MNTAERVEAAILMVGVLTQLVGAYRISIAGRWKAAMDLPPFKLLSLQPTDIGIVICLFVLMGQFLFSVYASMTGSQVSTSQSIDGGTEISESVTAVLGLAAQVMNIALVLVIVGVRLGRDFSAWGLTFERFGSRVVQAVLIYLASWPVCAGLFHLTKIIMELSGIPYVKEHSAILLLESGQGPAWLAAVTIVSAVILAPILEEFVFRGLIFRFLAEAWPSTWAAMAASATLFGLIHFSVPQTIPSLVMFGMVLAFAYAKSRSLTLVLLVHALFNLKTVVLIFLGAKS